MIFLWAYLALTLLVALWLGLMMWGHLDKFDWRHRSGDIWIGFVMSLLLWPLFLVTKPALILKGHAVRDIRHNGGMDLFGGLASRMRQLEEMTRNPPPCGSTVLYRCPESAVDGTPHISIWFATADIEQHFRGRDLPLFWEQEHTALVNFIKGRDESLEIITEIPEPVDFSSMSLDLLQHGYGEVECPVCQRRYSIRDMRMDTPERHAGWNFDFYSCPAGHPVLSCRTTHISMRHGED
ncbi:MAG: hypothetical protein AB7U63_00730 [Porticoccaceae bacterium]